MALAPVINFSQIRSFHKMKSLFITLVIAFFLSGCQAAGGWMALHSTAITQVSIGLGLVATGENIAIDSLTLKKDLTPPPK